MISRNILQCLNTKSMKSRRKNVLLRNKCTRPSLKTLNSACLARAKNSQNLPSAVAHLKNETRSINCQAADPQLSRFCLPTTQFSDHDSHAENLLNYSKVHKSHNLLFLSRRSFAAEVDFLIISNITATSQQFLNIKNLTKICLPKTNAFCSSS